MVRSVAQPGSALDWGSRGRGFESRRSDHFSKNFKTFILVCCFVFSIKNTPVVKGVLEFIEHR